MNYMSDAKTIRVIKIDKESVMDTALELDEEIHIEMEEWELCDERLIDIEQDDENLFITVEFTDRRILNARHKRPIKRRRSK